MVGDLNLAEDPSTRYWPSMARQIRERASSKKRSPDGAGGSARRRGQATPGYGGASSRVRQPFRDASAIRNDENREEALVDWAESAKPLFEMYRAVMTAWEEFAPIGAATFDAIMRMIEGRSPRDRSMAERDLKRLLTTAVPMGVRT